MTKHGIFIQIPKASAAWRKGCTAGILVTENGNIMFEIRYHCVAGVWTFVTIFVTGVLPFGKDSVYRLVTSEYSYCSNLFNLLSVHVLLRRYVLFSVPISLQLCGPLFPGFQFKFLDTQNQSDTTIFFIAYFKKILLSSRSLGAKRSLCKSQVSKIWHENITCFRCCEYLLRRSRISAVTAWYFIHFQYCTQSSAFSWKQHDFHDLNTYFDRLELPVVPAWNVHHLRTCILVVAFAAYICQKIASASNKHTSNLSSLDCTETVTASILVQGAFRSMIFWFRTPHVNLVCQKW